MQQQAKVETADVEAAVKEWFERRMAQRGQKVKVTKVHLTEDGGSPRGGPVVAKVDYTD